MRNRQATRAQALRASCRSSDERDVVETRLDLNVDAGLADAAKRPTHDERAFVPAVIDAQIAADESRPSKIEERLDALVLSRREVLAKGHRGAPPVQPRLPRPG